MSNRIKVTRSGHIDVGIQEEFVTEKHRRVDELLKAYEPTLELHWIPPGSRGTMDLAPWAVVHRPHDGPAYTVFFAEDADERLLARVIRSDGMHHNVLSEVEALNKAREALQMKEAWEARQEDHRLAAAILRSRKEHYKHNGVDFGEFRSS